MNDKLVNSVTYLIHSLIFIFVLHDNAIVPCCSCRYLPPEIGCLSNLEYLDLSFNKMRSLPVEITHLNSLLSLKVANNKLIEVPPGLSSLQRLENLDFSNNRLTSLENLDLLSMYNLQRLNLQVCVTENTVSFRTFLIGFFSSFFSLFADKFRAFLWKKD